MEDTLKLKELFECIFTIYFLAFKKQDYEW